MPSTLAFVALVHLATACAFFAVGHRLRGRAVATASRRPRAAFVTWWWAFGAYLTGQGALDLAAAAGWTPLAPFLAFRLLAGPLLALSAGALAAYMIYLWSGRWWAVPLGLYYLLAAVAYSTATWASGPTTVAVSGWSADLAYDSPFPSGLFAAVLASFGLPLVAGSCAYLGLLAKTHDRGQRYRISLVGSSLLLWVSSGYFAETAEVGDIARFVAIVLLGLLTAGAVTAAYFPPKGVRHWLEGPILALPPSS